MIELAGDSLYLGDYDAMRAWASRAVDAAALLDKKALTASALAIRALASAVSGRAAEGQAFSGDAAALIDSLADEQLFGRLDALAHLATADFYLENFAGAGSHAERALRIGRATGKGDLFPLVVPMLGGSLWVRGRMAEAGEVLDDAIAAARLVTTRKGCPGTSSTAPTPHSPPATSTWRSQPQSRPSTSRSSSTPAPSPLMRQSHSRMPASKPAIRSGVRSCSSSSQEGTSCG